MNKNRMTDSRSRSLWAVSAFALWMVACGNPTPTATTPTDTTTTPATATVIATPSPGTVTAAASPDKAYAWTGSFDVTISNTNTSPITIKSIAADLQQSSGGIVIAPVTGTDESFRFSVRAPGNRIDANSTMVIPFTFYYTLPNGGREAVVSLSFSVTTDAGASGAVTSSVKLQ
jgi:hypothetical protein